MSHYPKAPSADIYFPSIPFYIDAGAFMTEGTTYNCDPGDNQANHYIAGFCTANDGTWALNTVTCSTTAESGILADSVPVNVKYDCVNTSQCGDLTRDQCILPVTIYSGNTQSAMTTRTSCWTDGGSGCAEVSPTTMVRVLNKSIQTVSGSSQWIQADTKYGIGTKQLCDATQDAPQGYLNAFCTGGASTMTIPPVTMFCSDPNYAAPDSSLYADNQEVYNCNVSRCSDIPGELCASVTIDVIENLDTTPSLKFSCVADASNGCKNAHDINRPSVKRAGTTAKYWYVGSSDYLDDISYVCAADTDAPADDYVNVLCNHNGAVASWEVDCKAAGQTMFGDTKKSEDCTVITCETLGEAKCGEAVDLYTPGSGDAVTFINTCIQKSAGGCMDMVTNINRPSEMKDGTTANLWYVGSPDYQSTVTYTCTETDQPVHGYINVLCNDDGSVGTWNVACKDADMFGTTNTEDCMVVKCDQMTAEKCVDSVDLYIPGEGDDVVYVSTCMTNPEGGCMEDTTTTTTADPTDSGVEGTISAILVGLATLAALF